MKIVRHYAKKKVNDTLLKKLWPTRATEADIAKQIGVSRWTLRRRAVKLGLPSSRRELWKEHDQ
jgi:Zn-dependent peptidase ImmA (M78 family)